MQVLEKTVGIEKGLHLRAASEFVKLASKFQCDVTVRYGERHVNGKSILGLASLAAGHGAELVIELDGDDAQEARTAFNELFDNDFYEE